MVRRKTEMLWHFQDVDYVRHVLSKDGEDVRIMRLLLQDGVFDLIFSNALLQLLRVWEPATGHWRRPGL